MEGSSQLLPQLDTFAHATASVLEAAGIGIILFGAVFATVAFGWRLTQRTAFRDAYEGLRTHLGRAILLGLEFLVGADIIGTVAVEPTFRTLGVLGLIVLIRTFLSFSLEVEITGRWPWQGEGRKDIGA